MVIIPRIHELNRQGEVRIPVARVWIKPSLRWDGCQIPHSRFLAVGFAHAVLDCFAIPLDELPKLLGRRQHDQVA